MFVTKITARDGEPFGFSYTHARGDCPVAVVLKKRSPDPGYDASWEVQVKGQHRSGVARLHRLDGIKGFRAVRWVVTMGNFQGMWQGTKVSNVVALARYLDQGTTGTGRPINVGQIPPLPEDSPLHGVELTGEPFGVEELGWRAKQDRIQAEAAG